MELTYDAYVREHYYFMFYNGEFEDEAPEPNECYMYDVYISKKDLRYLINNCNDIDFDTDELLKLHPEYIKICQDMIDYEYFDCYCVD